MLMREITQDSSFKQEPEAKTEVQSTAKRKSSQNWTQTFVF